VALDRGGFEKSEYMEDADIKEDI
jgi:hypothetical protein